MAKDDDKGVSELGKQRSQVASSDPAGKPASTAGAGKSGDTGSKRGSSATELPPQFGRYRVIKKLGGGGMGTVYLVENTELEREEALKVPHFSDGDDSRARERFLREAKSAAKLDHANLCSVWDAGVVDGVYYMTMRFLKGKLLSEFTGEAQPARRAVEIVAKLAQALETAHAKGVIHRDLKPSNIMIVAGVGPVVMDFGLAKQIQQEDQKLTKAGAALGTPAYMPPEQVNGELEQMGPASDIYSLGVILYKLLTGRLPFEGTVAAIMGQILYTEPPWPSTLVPGLNPALDAICRKAMAKAPADRYPSMSAFAAALLDVIRATPAAEGASILQTTSLDGAAEVSAVTSGPGRQPTVIVDPYQVQGAAAAPQAKRRPTEETRAPSEKSTLRPRGDAKTQTTMGQRTAERKTQVAENKPARKKARRGPSLIAKVLKLVLIVIGFAVLVVGTLTVSIALFRPKHPSETLAADNSAAQQSKDNSAQPGVAGGDSARLSQGGSVQPDRSKSGSAQPGTSLASRPADEKIYLSDLKESNWHGQGSFSNNGRCPGAEDIAVNGTRFLKGLSTYPLDSGYSSVTYRLSGLDAAAFVTKVGINDTAHAIPPGDIKTALTFQVLGDGQVLWTSAPMRGKRQMQECQIRIKDVRALELRVDCPGSSDAAQAVWLDPYLLRSGARELAALDTEKSKSQASSGQTRPGTGARTALVDEKVYLSDLDEMDWVGHEEFGKNGKSKHAAIAVNGVPFPKGLWTHPLADRFCSVKYRISDLRAKTFVTQVSLNDSALQRIPTALSFQVLGDGKALWVSGRIRDKGLVQVCEISVRDVNMLELRVYCPGAMEGAHAVWLDPYLVRSRPRDSANDGGKSNSQASAAPPPGAVSPEGVLPLGADGQPLNFDFETGTLKDWTAQGDAFTGQPIRGDTVAARLRGTNIRSNHQGQFWIGTFERGEDRPQGTLTSVPFLVTYPRASFLIGGGTGPQTCVELVRSDTGQVFSRTSAANPPIETMRRVSVDLRSVLGKEIFIRVVDRDSNGWGHINFDDFRFQK